MSSTGTSEDVLQQMNQFWSLLDDFCHNDPVAYGRFIQEQMEEVAKFTAPPQLHSCIGTEMLEPRKGLLYVNICSWKCVPAPQDHSKPLPLFSGKLETDTDEGRGSYAVLDVAFNPAVLQESKVGKTEINKVYLLALNVAHQQHGLRLSQQHTLISCSPKSSPDDLYRRLGFRKWPSTPKKPDTMSQTPAALLQQISSLCSEKQHEEPAAQIIYRPAEHKKKDLIQVMSTTFEQPQKPEYQLDVKTNTAGVPCSIELTMELPKVCSMSECQLRMSKFFQWNPGPVATTESCSDL
ncbi:PIH1 domain-containing protein 2 isoform X2 [Mastacembelus armatus]|uniref:PIH1 domain-containing protein 2 isoform X2 n=1 Tax=Mastacembelus armatus TaxID=205130 RepID=UPI000E4577B0|nr:PIH1 domain-containing protein 2 isoform X2 [Mastacembelus armatus]